MIVLGVRALDDVLMVTTGTDKNGVNQSVGIRYVRIPLVFPFFFNHCIHVSCFIIIIMCIKGKAIYTNT